MIEKERFLLAEPLNWGRILQVLLERTNVQLVKLYEVREKGSTTVIFGFKEDSDSQPTRAGSTQRNTIQWELFPFKFEDPLARNYEPLD